MREASIALPSSASAPVPANNSPGLAAILRGTKSVLQPEQAFPPAPPAAPTLPRQRKRLIQLSLMLADVLLFGFAADVVLKSRGHLGFLEGTLCFLAVATGAWLTCLAFWLD